MEMKVQQMKMITIHPLGIEHVCNKLHSNLFNNCKEALTLAL